MANKLKQINALARKLREKDPSLKWTQAVSKASKIIKEQEAKGEGEKKKESKAKPKKKSKGKGKRKVNELPEIETIREQEKKLKPENIVREPEEYKGGFLSTGLKKHRKQNKTKYKAPRRKGKGKSKMRTKLEKDLIKEFGL